MASKYVLSRENAIKAVTAAVNQIYDKGPTWFRVTIQGGVDDIPTMKIMYDHYVFDAKVDGYEEVEQ